MDFSSLVLMEKEKETGYITKELGSFEVSEGAKYVKKLFVLEDQVYLYFDTDKDVEEWEYSAVYDLFNTEAFKNQGFSIEEDLEEYNPTFILKFGYVSDHLKMKEILDKSVQLISDEMDIVLKAIVGKEQEYSE